ncbi:SGNH/GDSL hydrolase family protein [Pseudomonas anguilliseptica]|jgi:lysophospholipase L1-like esterase|uniref:SGNH/GDSL hydrolase family protein n=1 Tax=Pseudomonas anguilliseptica TaxID=53406 RepID=UPI0022AF75A8|nr:SGNH/GDSL hydrolase family protein [Pseudomonas anguilliseptica]MCZ4323174.1 SGNH/GDSL hydrolase family protein [Pseudomonas anguilliseptica]
METYNNSRLALLDTLYEEQLQSLEARGNMGAAGFSGAGLPGFRSTTNIVAQGDSWFDYLPGNDIIKALKRRGLAIKNYATGGDTLENMLFGLSYRESNWERYPAEHLKVLGSIKTIKPKFFLFSGGGNDIAGPELAPYLNHVGLQSENPLREEHLDFMFRKVFRASFEFMIKSVSEAQPGIQILIHGYGHAIPTGKGVVNFGPWRFVGPWLRPSMTAKGILDPSVQAGVIRKMIDVLNEMLKELAATNPHVHYIDLRNLIKPKDWINELHLTHEGYEKVADAYMSLMQTMMTSDQRHALEASHASVTKFLNGDDSAFELNRP